MANQQPITERDVDRMVNSLRSYETRIAEALANGEKATARWLATCQQGVVAKVAATDIGWSPQ